VAKSVHGTEPDARGHGGEKYGCVWKHPVKGGPCDYRKNGYDESEASRTDLYNKDHKAIAIAKGYLAADGSVNVPNVSALVGARASAVGGKPAAWKTKWNKRLAGPFGLLKKDAKAWHIKHTYTEASIQNPWWPLFSATPAPKTNFLPMPHGGNHYFFPYKHNYHHIIERGSFHELVLNADHKDPVTPAKRKKIVIGADPMLRWNINNKANLILLPNEVAHADTVGLPSHCPWSTRSHPKYKAMLKKKLEEVREKIDKAVKTGAHPEITKAERALTQVEKDLLEEVKKIKGPL